MTGALCNSLGLMENHMAMLDGNIHVYECSPLIVIYTDLQK